MMEGSFWETMMMTLTWKARSYGERVRGFSKAGYGDFPSTVKIETRELKEETLF